MLRKSIVAAALLVGLVSSVARAADKVTPINTDKNAWIVRYGKEVGEGNKRKDLAVLLKIRENGENGFKATLVRFDHAASGKYFRAPGKEGKVEITGTYTRPGRDGNHRRPVRLKGIGSFIDGDQARVVKLSGVYHPGKIADSREDDRLSVFIRFQSLTPARGNGNGNGADLEPVEAGISTVDEPTIEFVAFFQPPCEEEPDTDVLAEESMPGPDNGIDNIDNIDVDP